MHEPSDAIRTTPPGDVLSDEVRRRLGAWFAVERELGRGGMGVVYLARDLVLDRLVALKVLPPDAAGDAAARARFLREARTAGSLAHPHIVPVHRADEVEGLAYFVMGFVDGESLADRLRERGPLPPADAVRVLREVAWALAYAHARGVVHRDVKPENILLERGTGRALVTDFGIARRADLTGDADGLTRAGVVLGTLHYMSPEQVAGGALDGRSDVYALGVVAYQALAGRLPFAELSGAAVLVAHATRPAPPLASVAPAVPAALAAVVDRCLAKDPVDRWATGEALAEALETALAAAPATARAAAVALPPDVPTVLGAAQASAIWRRAAQLQADALRRLESRDDLLPQVTRDATTRDATTRDAAPREALSDGYAVEHVVAAAQEAGISAQYVAMAIAELPRRAGAAARGVSERQATLFLATEQRSLAVSHVVDAPPARALRALGVALQQSPYELRLRDAVGAHPLDGGVLVFDLPGPIVGAGGAPGSQVNFYWLGTHQQLEARQVQVTLRALPGAPARTELTMTADLRPGVRRNVRASQWIAGVVGSGAGLLAGGIAAKGAAVIGAAVVGPAAAVGLGVAGLSIAWYRWLYPRTLEKATREMEGALLAVSAALRAEAVFGALPGPTAPPRPRGTGDDDLAVLVGAGL